MKIIDKKMFFVLQWENNVYNQYYKNWFFSYEELSKYNPDLILAFMKLYIPMMGSINNN